MISNKLKFCHNSAFISNFVSLFREPLPSLTLVRFYNKSFSVASTMDEHGMIHPDNLPKGMRIPDVPKVPTDLYISKNLDLDDIGRKYNKYFGKTKYVLIDLSGTLHIQSKETHGAVVALNKLRDSGVKIRFVTNTTKESKQLLYQRLRHIGFVLEKDEIFSSLVAARKKIEQLKIRPYFLIEDEAMEDFDSISTENPNGVVVGLSPTNFGYAGLNKAFKLLFHGCPLIAIHKGKYYKKEEGLSLGPGPFVHALEFATDSNAILVGKPNPEFFQAAISDPDIPASDVVMIGDDVEDDVVGAIVSGYNGILVKTGKYQNGDELKCNPKFPTVLADHFSQAVDIIVSSIAIEKGECLKVKNVDEKPSPEELKRLAAQKEKQRHIDSYTKNCEQSCYKVPPPTTMTDQIQDKTCDDKM